MGSNEPTFFCLKGSSLNCITIIVLTNSYGHPHAEPMNTFRSMGMKLFRTDEQGTIVAISDGREITWNCAPSESWQAGENTQSGSSTNTMKAIQNITASATIQSGSTEPEPTPAPVADVMVWKTKSGKKYHSINNCGNTDSSGATQITKTQAEALGLSPCSKCW